MRGLDPAACIRTLLKPAVNAVAALLLTLPGSAALGVSLGSPVLESGIGENLRVVLPVTVPPGRDKLGVNCVKLRADSNESTDISAQVRAEVVMAGGRQSLVLTTVRPLNDLVISVAVAIECGTWFTRRYTFLLDLPDTGRHALPVAQSGTGLLSAAAVATADASAPPPASGALPERVSGQPRRKPRVAAADSKAAAAGDAASARRASLAARPEAEPGVLASRPRTTAMARLKPLAPPVRSMLKIDLGGLGEFLASQPPRLLLEEKTGMRLASQLTDTGGAGAPRQASDPGFKLAHARYLAAMRDAPDPVSAENAALGQRLDGFSKELASLKTDLQTSHARANELEASSVRWWWLLIAAFGTAAIALGAAAWSRRSNVPAGPLIVLDPQQQPDPAVAAGNPAGGLPLSAPTDSSGTAQAFKPGDTHIIAPDTQVAPAPHVIVDDAPVVSAPPRQQAQVPATGQRTPIDKNSLSQQMATMPYLADEGWASFRHASDTSSVALPFGGGGAASPLRPAASPLGSELEGVDVHILDFEFDLPDVNPMVPAAAGNAAASAAPPSSGADLAPSQAAHAPLMDNNLSITQQLTAIFELDQENARLALTPLAPAATGNNAASVSAPPAATAHIEALKVAQAVLIDSNLSNTQKLTAIFELDRDHGRIASKPQALAAAGTAAAHAPAPALSLDAAPSPVKPPGAAQPPPDKSAGSLTQQLAAVGPLSDEAWASYRHPSDTSGVALPSGGLGSASPVSRANAEPASGSVTAALGADWDAKETSPAKTAKRVTPAPPGLAPDKAK